MTTAMRSRITRTAAGLALAAASIALAACGGEGSSGAKKPETASGAGCAPIAGTQLVVLDDDKKLQTADNIIAAVNAKAAGDPALMAALDKVAAALDTPKLIALNKAVDVDRKTSKTAAEDFAAAEKITDGLAKGAGGNIVIGAPDFTEGKTLGSLYEIALKAAGYTATVQTIGNRELYLPSLVKGEVQVVPEYAGTFTEFLNKKVNGASAQPVASGDVDKTVSALTGLADKTGLKVGKPSKAANQNAFAITKALADKYGVKTLSEFASKCSGTATVLGGPPECPQRPFCQPGLESTYSLKVGKFSSLDAGGPQTKSALTTGAISIGLVFSSDGALAAG